MVLEEAVSVAIELVQPAGSSFNKQAGSFSARIREVTVHGVRHGAVAALATSHLRLQPKVDLHVMELGFPSRAVVPKNIDIG